MNNYKVVQDSIKEEANPYRESIENRLEIAERILRSVQELQSTKAYLDFKDLVLVPSISLCERSIESYRKELTKPKSDVQEIMRQLLMNESMLIAFKKFSGFEELEKVYKVEIIRLKQALKNAKTEKS